MYKYSIRMTPDPGAARLPGPSVGHGGDRMGTGCERGVLPDGTWAGVAVGRGLDRVRWRGSAEQIQEVLMDMSPTYRRGIGEHLPEAHVTFDPSTASMW